MAEGIPCVFAVDLTRKWRALAERRKAHLVDLYDSGRWQLYYTEREFVQRLREAIGAVERWSATERSVTGEVVPLPAVSADAEPLGAAGEATRCATEALTGSHLNGTDNEAVAEAANGVHFGDFGDREFPEVEQWAPSAAETPDAAPSSGAADVDLWFDETGEEPAVTAIPARDRVA